MSSCHSQQALLSLVEKGVNIPSVDHVLIGQEVSLDKISAGATLHPFCQIKGSTTTIYPNAQIGQCGPAFVEHSIIGSNAIIGQKGAATIISCTVGKSSVLGAGVAEHAVFLGKETTDNDFTTGVGFRVRKGSLYEEDASSAQHTDTKMTILFPWVTLGSNINFCDALVAGGVSPKLGDFSEVGSGSIHFNFTPYGDKATASLIGNVIDGVFLDQKRIFIGGNNSLIGPIESAFGAVSAAGARVSHLLEEGLNFGRALHGKKARPFQNKPRSVSAILKKQMRYISELSALLFWYDMVRATIATSQEQTELYRQGRQVVFDNLKERTTQVKLFVQNNSDQNDHVILSQLDTWLAHLPQTISQHQPADWVFESIQQTAQEHEAVYTKTIQNLDNSVKQYLHQSLEKIVSCFHQQCPIS